MTKRYDCDNLAKLILDVGNGILWHDDRQIVSLKCEKKYTLDQPRTEIVIDVGENIPDIAFCEEDEGLEIPEY